MPANLNALIRYKQIDRCLRNRFSDCTIEKMQEVCSDALAEYRGVYKKVSERTIRDDLRVMRSEMLGFNAPIVFENGRYFYSDPEYSIFQTPIAELNLLKEVFNMLIKERDNIRGSEVDELLKKIADITGDKIPELEVKEESEEIQEKKIITKLERIIYESDELFSLNSRILKDYMEKSAAPEKTGSKRKSLKKRRKVAAPKLPISKRISLSKTGTVTWEEVLKIL